MKKVSEEKQLEELKKSLHELNDLYFGPKKKTNKEKLKKV